MPSNLLLKAIIGKPYLRHKTTPVFATAKRNHWNYQYKPGPYPVTVEQREAAAKRYGLSFEEYQPYPEEMGFGDYPKMPDIGADSKDPFYPYDMPELKRNFNEPMHASAEIFGEDRYDISMKPRFPVWYQALWFFGVMGTFFTLYLYLEDFKIGRPMHASAEIFGEDRYDISMKPRFPVWYQALWFFGVMGTFFTLYLYLEDFKIGRPVTCKQFPKDGPHFDFPPAAGGGHH